MDDLIEEVRALCARAQERLDWRRGWIGVVSVTFLVTAGRGARSSSRWVSALRAPSRFAGFPRRFCCRLPLPLVLVAAGLSGAGISDVASPSAWLVARGWRSCTFGSRLGGGG